MQNFIRKPDIELLPGIRVTRETALAFKNENVEQVIRDYQLHTVMVIEGEGYKSKSETTIYLEEGDVLLFEEDGRGYIKPVEDFVTIEEAIDDLTNIKDLG